MSGGLRTVVASLISKNGNSYDLGRLLGYKMLVCDLWCTMVMK